MTCTVVAKLNMSRVFGNLRILWFKLFYSMYNHSFVPNNLLQIWTIRSISFKRNDYSAFTSV